MFFLSSLLEYNNLLTCIIDTLNSKQTKTRQDNKDIEIPVYSSPAPGPWLDNNSSVVRQTNTHTPPGAWTSAGNPCPNARMNKQDHVSLVQLRSAHQLSVLQSIQAKDSRMQCICIEKEKEAFDRVPSLAWPSGPIDCSGRDVPYRRYEVDIC